MITLLHGDYIEASRNELTGIIQNARSSKEIRTVDGRSVDDTNLVQAVESSSLFGGETVTVIEQLFGKLGRQQKRIESLCAILSRVSKHQEIILWEDKELTPATVRQLGNGNNIRLFKLPVLIFQFLDGIRPHNEKILLTVYQKLIVTESPELVFAMLVKRMRHLIQLNDGVVPSGLAPWQASRLTTQAKSFTMEKLLNMYKKLHTIEVSLKSGLTPFSIQALTEQFVMEV